MNIYVAALVIFLTALVAIGGSAWWMGRRERIPLDRLADPAPMPGELPRAGYLPGPPFAGAQDPAYQLAPIPWDLASAAYALGQQRADQDAVTREVDAIMAEIEANPERWQT